MQGSNSYCLTRRLTRLGQRFFAAKSWERDDPFSRAIPLTVRERFETRSDIIPGLFFILMTRVCAARDVRHE